MDACVLYPAPLRDLLVSLSVSGLYQAKWSAQIHDEWIRNLLINRPDLTRDQLLRTCELMNNAVEDSLVTGFDNLISEITLPDVDDRHVIAAAISSKSNFIVTMNLKDFPISLLEKHQVQSIHPDEFISVIYDKDHMTFCDSVFQIRNRLKHPTVTPDEYIESIRLQSMPKVTKVLHDNIHLI